MVIHVDYDDFDDSNMQDVEQMHSGTQNLLLIGTLLFAVYLDAAISIEKVTYIHDIIYLLCLLHAATSTCVCTLIAVVNSCALAQIDNATEARLLFPYFYMKLPTVAYMQGIAVLPACVVARACAQPACPERSLAFRAILWP